MLRKLMLRQKNDFLIKKHVIQPVHINIFQNNTGTVCSLSHENLRNHNMSYGSFLRTWKSGKVFTEIFGHGMQQIFYQVIIFALMSH